MSQRRKGQESGFALLFVLLAAAMVAIFLYSQMPQVAFEGQRQKEADLIAHGEQYKRAIKLFFRQFGRYPPSIEALENTNNIRFLRRRFKDPMTGKDDWRFIHAAGPGMFTDSLTKKPPTIPGTTSASDMAAASSGSASSGDANSTDPSQQTPQRWQLRRPQTGSPDAASANPDAPPDDSQQQAVPGQPVYIPPGGGALQPGDPGYAPGQLQPGQPGYQPGQPGGRPQPGGQAYGNPSQPLYPNVPLPGMPSGGFGGNQSGGTPATGSGQSGNSSTSSGSTSSGGGFGMMPGGGGGAGIAGVASRYEASGIKIYKDHAKYNEWEFIYDPRDEILALGGALPQTPTDQTGLSGAPGFSQPGTPLGGQPGTQTGSQPGTQQPGTSNPN